MHSYTLSIAQGSYTAIAAQIHSSLKARKKPLPPLQKILKTKKNFGSILSNQNIKQMFTS
jgi:hypothetical protein